jgi:hypothetical protein
MQDPLSESDWRIIRNEARARMAQVGQKPKTLDDEELEPHYCLPEPFKVLCRRLHSLVVVLRASNSSSNHRSYLVGMFDGFYSARRRIQVT